jgi:putative DNA primase/helicase
MNVVNENHLLGLEHALDLASRGWPVVPYLMRADGSQLSDWPNIATRDPEQIDAWFGLGQPYEGAYVATIPGLVGKTVIDFDAHPDKPNGFETAEKLRLPSTASVSFPSASGVGRHNWFDGASTSKAIYPGIDRKSRKGLVRVTYLLPNVEDVYESLPSEFQINDTASTGREYLGRVEDWLDAHAGAQELGLISKELDKLPNPFVGHPEMLRFQTRVVFLGAEGHGGAPEALAEGKEKWCRAPHRTSSRSPELDYTRALYGAIVAFGGEPPKPTVESHPDEFFEKSRLKSKTLAEAISYDLAIGPDGGEWVYEAGVWCYRPDEVVRRTVRVLGDRFNTSHSSTMKLAVLHGVELPHIRREADQENINLLNGMLEWRTLELKPHQPEYMSTVQLPVEYSPEALCPNFDKWVDEVIQKDCQQIFWEFLGYMMMSGNPLQVAILLYGVGGNGKGTVLRLLAQMLGKNNISNVDLKSISENKFAMADMFGKIANIAGDIDAKYLNDTAQFKQITGEDTVRAEKKFKDSFAYNPWAVPVFSANKLWRSADDTEGYLRRWIIIPLSTELDRSKNFDENVLWAEASGIFNKAIANLQVLIARGKFSPTGSALEVMDEFRTQNDPVRLWLKDESSIYVNLPNSRMLRESVYENYRWWCISNGYKAKAKDQLFKSLRNEKFKEQSSNGRRYFVGLCPASEVIVTGETVVRL